MRFFLFALAGTPFVALFYCIYVYWGWNPPFEFYLGLVVAGLFGRVYFTLSEWLYDAGAHKRKQTVGHQTSETPEQVMQRAAAARLRFIGVVLFIVVMAGAALYSTGELDYLVAQFNK